MFKTFGASNIGKICPPSSQPLPFIIVTWMSSKFGLKEIAEKRDALETLEEEKSKLLDKLNQYKQRMIDMKNSIEELDKANVELQKRLDEEIKQKNGM